ncbi:MAG TPA: universal stress protein [Bryobacteraceae bacterium]|nr:universal stress protein [Bryobacteraceae bacterium]
MDNLSIRRILVPIDLSARSADAAEYAQVVSDHFDAELILLHVLEPLAADFAMTDPGLALMTDFMGKRKAEAEAALDRVGPPAGAIRRLITQGDPAEQILDCATKVNADLIVMPTQGHSRVRQFLIGSVTAKVLHDAIMPVLTGVHLAQVRDFPAFGLKHILCAVDLGSQSESVAILAKNLAKKFGARVTLIHVLQASEDASERIASLLKTTGLEAEVVIGSGEPHKVVTATAEKLMTDLVVIGRGSSSSVVGRLRAQAYSIVRQAPCPVLSV